MYISHWGFFPGTWTARAYWGAGTRTTWQPCEVDNMVIWS